MLAQKQCASCKQQLPVSKFGQSLRAKDGLRSYCSACNSEASRKTRFKKMGKTYTPLPDRSSLQANLTTATGWEWLKDHLPPSTFKKLESQWVADKLKERKVELNAIEKRLFKQQENVVSDDTLECEDCRRKDCICDIEWLENEEDGG